MSRTFAHDYSDGGGRYRYNPTKWEEKNGYWLGGRRRIERKNNSPNKPYRFRHHSEFRVKLYKPEGKAWWLKPPSWCTRDFVIAPNRAKSRSVLKDAVKVINRDDLEDIDTPEFFGELKNADWIWT